MKFSLTSLILLSALSCAGQQTNADFSKLLEAAETGAASAQNSVGISYATGDGVDKDKAKAVEWYRKAAKQGLKAAEFNLGTAYYNGDGVVIDDVAAATWFLIAREAGSEPARDAVEREAKESPERIDEASLDAGDKYLVGTEIPQDYGLARKFYQQAADHKERPAYLKLANLYIKGQGVKQDYPEAGKFCKSAADLNYPPAMFCLGFLAQRTESGAIEGENAASWYERGAGLGDTNSLVNLGVLYSKGEHVERDAVRAYSFFLIAGLLGNPNGLHGTEMLKTSLTNDQTKKGGQEAVAFAKKHNLRLRYLDFSGPKR